MSKFKCPKCGNDLTEVRYSADCMLNRDQWESQLPGDLFCTCHDNSKGHMPCAYFWKHELEQAESAPVPQPSPYVCDYCVAGEHHCCKGCECTHKSSVPVQAEGAESKAFSDWNEARSRCVGYPGGCDGDLPGEEHRKHCPMFGKADPTYQDVWNAAWHAALRSSLPAQPDAERTVEALRAELARAGEWRKMCIIEIAVENQSVADYIQHWEGRTLSAEARVSTLEEALRELLRVDDAWHGSVNSEMSAARLRAREALNPNAPALPAQEDGK